MSAWVDITPLENGDLLDKVTLEAPLKDLESRTDYLNVVLGSYGYPFTRVTLNFSSVSENLSAGDVVYINSNGLPEKASGVPDVHDEFLSTRSSYIVGIYLGSVDGVHKVSVCGSARISLQAFGDHGGTESGVYFLSTESGKEGQITLSPSGARILVGTFIKHEADNYVEVFLTPTHNSFAEAHVHRTAILSTTITSTDGAEGWHLVEGTTYKYVSTDTVLNSFWPPVPFNAVSFVLDGKELIQSSSAITGVNTYCLNANLELQITLASAPAGSTIGSTAVIHYVRGVHGDSGPVTSLWSAEGSPIVIKKCGTDKPGHVGDLELDLDWDAQDKDANTPGYKVYKKFEGGVFLRGPVVEKVESRDGIDIESTDTEGHGTVVISLNAYSSGQFDTVALQNAKQEMVGLFPYISLPTYNSSIPSAFVAKFQAPLTLTNQSGYNVYFYATLFGTVNGASSNTAGVSFLYNILPDGGATGNRLNISDDLISGGPSSPIQIPFGDGYKGFDPLLLTNDPSYDGQTGAVYVSNLFSDAVKASYQVAVQLKRASSTYSGAVGFLNLRWRLIPILSA